MSEQSWKIWRSVEDRNKEPNADWQNNAEFPQSVKELIDRGSAADLDRKSFLTLMGASLAMASVSCMKEPVEKIVPYVERPVDHVPGVPVFYASALVTPERVTPVLIKTREGKPMKVEGNTSHPLYKGAVDADVIASIWDLYDPDRILKSSVNGKEMDYSAVIAAVAGKLTAKSVILTRSSFSPSENEVIAAAARGRKLVVYDATGNLSEAAIGEKKSFGTSGIPQYRIDKADLILAIENDFLGTWLTPDLFTRQFTSRRNPDGNMNRLIVAETMMSLTGANADTRLPIASGTHITFAFGLANLLLPGSALAGDATVKSVVSAYTPEVTAAATGLKAEEIVAIAEELKKYKGRSLVLAGGVSARSGETGAAQIAANLLNAILGNDGRTISTRASFAPAAPWADHSAIVALVDSMKKGEVDTIVIDRANPVYDLTAYGFASALAKVPNVIYIGSHINATSAKSSIIVAASHQYESWSDGLSNGYYTVAQPTIRPLFDTLSAGDIWLAIGGVAVADLAKDDKNFFGRVSATSRKYIKGNYPAAFDRALAAGYVAVEAPAESGSRRFNSAALKGELPAPSARRNGIRLSLYRTVQIGDGSGANISFRQELPDPVTKITWENVLAVSPIDARENNWKFEDLVEVTVGGSKLSVPVFLQPGLPAGSAALAIGYGQKELGAVAKEAGVNAYALAASAGAGVQYAGLPASIRKIDSGYKVASTQRHYELGQERGLVRMANLSDYKKDPKAGNYEHELPGKGLYPKHEYKGNRWNLNIDLSKCTGCSSCVVGCYSENNIPAVGKKEVWRGREMSWLRIDRYYGDPAYTGHSGHHGGHDEAHKEGGSHGHHNDDVALTRPAVFFQPLMCQHCENAPCENVCPVGATGHSEDGLNYMTYNRCIGTRYCANNCPYKVRRFNWFENWEDKIRDPQQYALNPDVTVRSRGVIEKCSFCQQRISEARQKAKSSGVALKDGDIKTACQTACPADAITFGDVNDANSRVAQLADPERTKRSYKILAAINVQPAVSYLVRVKNQG